MLAGLRLRPGAAAAVIGCPASEFRDMRVSLDSAFGVAGSRISESQLRRRFETAVGYGPKRLGRVFRLQRLLDLIHQSHGRANWSQLAAAAGYTDQPHMINECLALTGGPPTALPMSVLSNTAAGPSS